MISSLTFLYETCVFQLSISSLQNNAAPLQMYCDSRHLADPEIDLHKFVGTAPLVQQVTVRISSFY